MAKEINIGSVGGSVHINNKDQSVQFGDHAQGNTVYHGGGPAILSALTTELQNLRALFEQLNTPDQPKIQNALKDVETELQREQPERDEIETTLERAMKYAKRAQGFAALGKTFKTTLASFMALLP